MSLVEELMVYIATGDRANIIRFRQRIVKQYGKEKFLELVKQAEKELFDETHESK